MDSLIGLLLASRVDVIPENTYVMRYYLRKHKAASGITEYPLPASTVGMYLHISKKSDFRKVLDRFDRTVKTMREEGALERIYNRYR